MHRMHRIFSENGQLAILAICRSARNQFRSRLLVQQALVLLVLIILCIDEPFAKFGSGAFAGIGHKRHKNTNYGFCAFCAFLWLDSLFHQVEPDIEKGRTSADFAKSSDVNNSSRISDPIPPFRPMAAPSRLSSNPLVALRRSSCAFVDNSFQSLVDRLRPPRLGLPERAVTIPWFCVV